MTNQGQHTAPHSVEHIEFDDTTSREFSNLIEGLMEPTDYKSITSSIRDHVYENGRRYHSLNAGKYLVPNDEEEQERLDMLHHTISLMLGGALHVAALPKKLRRILDCGTGTGIWAIDMADAHPDATVIGVDLSPIQPTWVPENCTFEVDDLEKTWLWDEPFDFIHSSNLSQGIRDWQTYIDNMYENLTPNGVVQLHESELGFSTDNHSAPEGGYLAEYKECFDEATKRAGLKDVCADLEDYLLNAGFVDVRVVVKKLPIGLWPKDPRKKELGMWGLSIMSEGLKSYGLALMTRYLGKSTEEATWICEGAFSEFRRSVHAYNAQWFVEGRKPMVGEFQ